MHMRLLWGLVKEIYVKCLAQCLACLSLGPLCPSGIPYMTLGPEMVLLCTTYGRHKHREVGQGLTLQTAVILKLVI